jgi:hypothetical protein
LIKKPPLEVNRKNVDKVSEPVFEEIINILKQLSQRELDITAFFHGK